MLILVKIKNDWQAHVFTTPRPQTTPLLFPPPATWSTLPFDIKITIFSFIRPPGSLLPKINREFYSLYHKEALWELYYKHAFGPIPCNDKEDIQAQYYAEHLFREALNTPRNDLAQIIFIKLAEFLVKYKQKQWTEFYFGFMRLEGCGLKAEPEKSFPLLLSCFQRNDIRSIYLLTDILIKIKNDQSFFEFFITSIGGQETLSQLFARLKNIKEAKAYRLLGYLYLEGIGTDSDAQSAEKYFSAAFEEGDALALRDIMDLKLRWNDPNSNQKHSAENLMNYLENLLAKTSSKLLLREIYYTMGTLSENIFHQTPQAIHYFKLAETKEAKRQIGRFYSQLEDGRDIEFLQAASDEGDSIATEILFDINLQNQFNEESSGNYPNENEINDFIHSFKTTARKGNNIVKKISEFYYQKSELSELFSNPEKIWWIQLAAEHGCEDSLAWLQNNPTPFTHCALGLIHQFGILNSVTLEANTETAKEYFSAAIENDKDVIENYIQAGKNEQLICPEVEHFLQSQMQPILGLQLNA